MVVIERIDDRGIKGVLTDGYLPDFSFYQKKDWDYALKEKLLESEEFQNKFRGRVMQNYGLKTGRTVPTVRSQSNFHTKLNQSLLKRFCQYNGEPCFQQLIPAEGVWSMDRKVSLESVKLQRAIYPAFSKEIEKAQNDGRNYYFSLTYLDLNDANYCPVFEDCYKNWMDFMGFEIKREEEYIDFNAYRRAAEIFISTDLDFARKRLSEDRNYNMQLFRIF
jgi:hypothetical protein